MPLASARWLNRTPGSTIDSGGVRIVTIPDTDLWQRTYYGFRRDTAPALLLPVTDNITFTVRAAFDYGRRYDQAGILLRVDEHNWVKASIEYEDGDVSRLGSVVTSLGYSDWATRDIPSVRRMWYRASLRGPDVLLQACPDGENWEQLRILHMPALGETTADMGRSAPTDLPRPRVEVGVYACSPEASSFSARFDRISVRPSLWQPHS